MRRACVIRLLLIIILPPIILPPIILPPIILPTLATADDWPQAGNNPAHTGYSPETILPPLKLKWNIQLQPERVYPAVQAVVADGRVYVGTEQGNLYALDAGSGQQLWKFPWGETSRAGPIMHTAGFAGGRVFVASLDGCVYAIDAQSGELLWKFTSRLRTGFSAAVLLAHGKVFAAHRGGTLFTLSQMDGKLIWKADLGSPLLQTPAYHDGRVFVAGMNRVLHALDEQRGETLWKTEPIDGLAFKDYWPVVHQGLVIVRPMGPWEATAFEEKTGKRVDLKIPGGITMNGAVAPPCVDQDGRLVTALGGGWARVDAATGKLEEISEKQGRGGRGNQDENMIASACRDLIFVMHCQEGNAQFTGCYQLSKKTWTPIRGGPWLNLTSNTQGGGASQAAIAGGALYHVSLHGVRCFEGEPR
jgi:outer membrane protein assembly factor BamB